jgi:hypothetical protein
MTCGVYLLKFKGTDRVYIGQALDIEKRKISHNKLFRKGAHTKKLQKAYDEFGFPDQEVVMECLPKELDEVENEAIQIWDSVNNGLNTLERAGDSPKYSAKGEEHWRAKYSNQQIQEVFLQIIENKFSLKEISVNIDVGYTTVRTIANGTKHTWLKEVFPEKYAEMLNAKNNRKVLSTGYGVNAKFSREQIEQAFLLLTQTKKSRKEIAETTNTNYKVVSHIADGSAYPWLRDKYPEQYAVMLDIVNNYSMQ